MQDFAALAAVFLVGVVAGAAVNWAVYALAWRARAISPWSAAHPQAPARRGSDRLPVAGWWGLRREEPLHGRGFWVRPALVELLMGAGFVALWRWEVDQQGLVAAQFAALAGRAPAPAWLAAPAWITYATFASHAVLIALMAAASLIDIDEKTIPDAITAPGTLAGLALAAVLPMALLPHVAFRSAAPEAGVVVQLPAAGAELPQPGAAAAALLAIEPTTLIAPNAWPESLGGAPRASSLVVGLGCYATWCIALAPRILRRRRGIVFGLRVLTARVLRELSRPPLAWAALVGAAAITGVWFRGGAAWVGLLSSLVGMIGGAAMVWAVRIAATSALRREALGFGDVTLMMMVGAFLGWQAGVVTFFLAPFAGLVIGLLQLALRRDDEIFFGPFLCLAALVVMVRWGTLWNADSPLQAVFGEPWLVPAVLALGVVVLWALLVMWRNIKEAALGPARNTK